MGPSPSHCRRQEKRATGAGETQQLVADGGTLQAASPCGGSKSLPGQRPPSKGMDAPDSSLGIGCMSCAKGRVNAWGSP